MRATVGGLVLAMVIPVAAAAQSGGFLEELRAAQCASAKPAKPVVGLAKTMLEKVEKADRQQRDRLLAALRDGRTDADLRRQLHEFFEPRGVEASHSMMEEIRKGGLLDAFLAASLRGSDGRPVDPTLFATVRHVMRTGRLDVYAETLTSVPFNVIDDPKFGGHYFHPGEKAVYMNRMGRTPTVEEWAGALAHETFHAYSDAHGSSRSALDEGMGIAASRYGLENGTYDIAEMVYGTKSFYRDVWKDGPGPITMGNMNKADRELREFFTILSSRDRSGLQWEDTGALNRDYERYWEKLDRDALDWEEQAKKATVAMLRDRALATSVCGAPARFTTWGTNVARDTSTDPTVPSVLRAGIPAGAGMLRD